MNTVRLGLRENLGQFALLVVVNAFVGAMVGMERSILPTIAEQTFHLAARTARAREPMVLPSASDLRAEEVPSHG